MENTDIKKIVYKYYEEGFHCAEAIVNTFAELFPENSRTFCMAASGFCGGIGECKQDVCGALSGGVIALGAMYGRENGGKDISELVTFAAELRRLFHGEFKSTVCCNVIENINKREEEFESCRDVTAKTAELLYSLLKKDQDL